MVSAVGGQGEFGMAELMQLRRQMAAQQTSRKSNPTGITGTASSDAQSSAASSQQGLTGTSGSSFTSQLADFLLKFQESAGGANRDGPPGAPGEGRDPVGKMLGQAASSGSSISKADFEKGLSGSGTSGGTTAADDLFSKLDTNGDGTVNPSEARTAIENHRKQQMAGGPPPFDPTQTGGPQQTGATDATTAGQSRTRDAVGNHRRHHHRPSNGADGSSNSGTGQSSSTASSGTDSLSSLMSTLLAQLQGQQSTT